MANRFHPIQFHNPPREVPEAVALRSYEVYCALYGEQAAMVDAQRGFRGGFSISEHLGFLYAHSFPKEEWLARFEEALERRTGGSCG